MLEYNEITDVNNTELEARSKELDFAGEITKVETSFCSLAAETTEEKKMMFNVINNTDELLKEHVNEELRIIGFYIEEISVVDEKTGEIKKIPRIVLIDENFIGYGCASFGIYNSLKKLINMLGIPTKDNPYVIKIKNRTLKNNYITLTMELV